MKTAKMMTSSQALEKLQESGTHPDHLFKRKGNFIARWTYFYKGGKTVEKYCKAVVDAGFEVVSSSDNWNVWPTTSYFEVLFVVKNENPQ